MCQGAKRQLPATRLPFHPMLLSTLQISISQAGQPYIAIARLSRFGNLLQPCNTTILKEYVDVKRLPVLI